MNLSNGNPDGIKIQSIELNPPTVGCSIASARFQLYDGDHNNRMRPLHEKWFSFQQGKNDLKTGFAGANVGFEIIFSAAGAGNMNRAKASE